MYVPIRELQSNDDSPAAKAGVPGVMKGSFFLRGTTAEIPCLVVAKGYIIVPSVILG